ncbi:MAG: iron ABC transporter permease [Sphaerochaetaceae bacterium]|nr:iron ABC transporter permease [Sphaerochaetaceae bacterium]
MEKKKYGRRFAALIILALTVFITSFLLGRYKISIGATVRILSDALIRAVTANHFCLNTTWSVEAQTIVLNVRLPRIACAALVGAALSVAGASFQGMFRNPMVSPDLLGASTGAGFGAALAIFIGASYYTITLFAFLCGLSAVMLTYVISRLSKIKTTLALVLSGIVVGSLFQSGTSFIKLVADQNNQLPAITYWLMGSLSSVKNRDFLLSAVPILLGLIPIVLLRWRINLLTVSEAEARSMGIETATLRFVVIICATLMTSASVAISGMIGWIGLVIPHCCRLVFGQDYRRLIPSSAIAGAAFLMLTDNIARTVATSEIPLGILTSLIGAPAFIYLIVKGGSASES